MAANKNNITLISTQHRNIGECTARGLCEILDHIKPEVIFEELPPSLFNRYYLDKTHTNLEVEAIQTYLIDYKTQHIPVDLDETQSAEVVLDYKDAVERVLNLNENIGLKFKHIIAASKRYTATNGFRYLNSLHYITYIEERHHALEEALRKINDNRLSQAYRSWIEFSNRRENAMLHNIYDYSKNHDYTNAIFLLGAGHRKSIIDKIQNWESEDGLKLNWSIHNG